MTYPYIGKREETGNTIIFLNENKGIRISEPFDFICTRDKWKESAFKNITAEYLANTYGEVKSKEHAEFIVKLAEVNGRDNYSVISFDEAKSFVFDTVGDLKLYRVSSSELSSVSHLKLITIPLPPECESVDEWPKVGDEVQTSDGVGSVKLLPDSKGYYVISIKDEYYQYQLSELSKPKTPEQELRNLLLLLWEENNHDFDMLLDVVTEHVIKKPQ